MGLTLMQIKQDSRVNAFIKRTDDVLGVQGFTEHGFRHVNLVADRARNIAQSVGLSRKEQELCAIAGYTHDMGNFLGRMFHHYWGALLFSQIFLTEENAIEVALITEAITNHDKDDMKLASAISAVLVLADKSDVHRSRVSIKSKEVSKMDIHDRVNYAVTESKLGIDKKNKRIILGLKLDTKIIPIMEYFEIFIERMAYCRKAAEFLNYQFGLEINKVKLA